MYRIQFDLINKRIKDMVFPEVDTIIGIGTGGYVPASMIALNLGRDLITLRVNFRNSYNDPIREYPEILSEFIPKLTGRNILLVDDVSVSGKTLEYAKSLFPGNSIKTFVLKGEADLTAFPEIKECVIWPWK